MEANTRIKLIKIHTVVISDPEIEEALINPDPLIDFLRTLLIAKAPPNGHSDPPADKPRKKKQSAAGKVNCQYCDRLISTRQIGNHENKCSQRPVAAPQE